MGEPKPRVLCVDDEPNILDGLSLHLRRKYSVTTATSGQEGLQALASGGSFAVVVSDMRMPGMDGATFLGRVRALTPSTVRVLLTGQSDLDSAIVAINEGQIFRFLTKPCSPTTLLGTLAAATEQHRLLTAERVLLEETLQGCIQALTDILSLVSPALFGRALRLRLQVSELAMKLGTRDRWQVEVAAMLSQVGCVALPADTLDRLLFGQRLSANEATMVARVPAVTEQLLASIPRLEGVRAILAAYGVRFAGEGALPQRDLDEPVRRSAMILRVAADFDSLELRGIDAALALSMMRSTLGCYDREVLDALASVRGVNRPSVEVRELPLEDVEVGMVLAEDMRTGDGTLIVAHGYEVTAGFVERTHNHPELQGGNVRVVVKAAGQSRVAAPADPELAVRI